MTSSNKEIIKIFQEQGGYLSSKELNRSTKLYRQLRYLLISGEVEKIGKGLYYHIGYPRKDTLNELAKQHPGAVFCMYSAWDYYNLSTNISHYYCLAVKNKARLKIADYPPLKIYYWSDHLYELEIKEEAGIKIYSIEKSICDAVKFRNKIGKALLSEILKNYLLREDKDLNHLFFVSKKMKVNKLLLEYLNMIL